MKRPGKAVKLSEEAYARVQRLCEIVAERGWNAVGLDGRGLPTRSAIVDAATSVLAARAAAKGARIETTKG